MRHHVIIAIGSGIVFVITGWYLRGQGTFYSDKLEYLFGQGLIAVGLCVLCLEFYQLSRGKNREE